jgi:hypothetical protein
MRFAWAAAVVGLAAGAFLLVGDEPSSDVVAGTASSRPGRGEAPADLASTTGNAEPEHGGSGLSIREIAYSLVEGGQDFVIAFDGPVPDTLVSHLPDIENVDVPAVGYTTQEWTPENPTPLRTCGDTHFGFSPPVTVGQADVLMPAEWFSGPPDTDEIVWTQDPEGFALKTALCGPHDGYVQYAIWSPASHDPDDIRVYFDGETRLVVEIRPGTG